MKQSQYSEVFRIIPQHTRTFLHAVRPNREVHASVCCAFLPHTRGCTGCASAFSVAPQLLTGQSPVDFLTAHSFRSRFTQLQNNLFPYCCIQRGVTKPPLDCHRAVLQLQVCASPQQHTDLTSAIMSWALPPSCSNALLHMVWLC